MNKNKELEEIQHTLQQIFIKNLDFFKQHFPHLYDNLIQFENLQIENYSLEFIDNAFQLIDLHTKKKFYRLNPFAEAQQRLQEFNFSNAFAMIKLEPIKKERHYSGEINAYEYINQYLDKLDDTNMNQEIQKFVFIGTLLGVHINDFHAKLKARSYLILEPNIEIFRLSMFMTDYSELAKDASLHFCIAQENENSHAIINDFLKDKQEFNHLIHYELSHKEYEDIISNLALTFTQFSEMRYPFSEYLISLKRGYDYFLKEKKPLLNLLNKYSFLEKKPIIFLGAGPSLADNIEWLQKNQHDLVIVASSAALKQLALYDIAPDIIVIIEGREEVITQFPEDNSIYQESIVLSSIKIDTNVYELLKNNPLYLMQNSLELFLNHGFFSGITVGDVGIDLLLKLGATELYLLGIDAALSKTGETHVGTHPASSKVDLTHTKTSHSTDFEKDIHYVKGNFQESVPTTIEYLEMIEHLNESLSHLPKNIQIYNLSDGAYFNHTIAMKASELEFKETKLNKPELKKTLMEQLESISKHTMNETDIKNLQKEKKVLKKLLDLKRDEQIYKHYLQLKRKFEYSIVINIVNRYFNLMNPYHNFFNDKKAVILIQKAQIEALFEKLNTIYSEIKER